MTKIINEKFSFPLSLPSFLLFFLPSYLCSFSSFPSFLSLFFLLPSCLSISFLFFSSKLEPYIWCTSVCCSCQFNKAVERKLKWTPLPVTESEISYCPWSLMDQGLWGEAEWAPAAAGASRQAWTYALWWSECRCYWDRGQRGLTASRTDTLPRLLERTRSPASCQVGVVQIKPSLSWEGSSSVSAAVPEGWGHSSILPTNERSLGKSFPQPWEVLFENGLRGYGLRARRVGQGSCWMTAAVPQRLGWGYRRMDDSGTSMGGYDDKIILSSELDAALWGISHSLKNYV